MSKGCVLDGASKLLGWVWEQVAEWVIPTGTLKGMKF